MRRCSVFDAYGVKRVNRSVIQHEVDCDFQCIKTQLETKVFLFHSSLKQDVILGSMFWIGSENFEFCLKRDRARNQRILS